MENPSFDILLRLFPQDNSTLFLFVPHPLSFDTCVYVNLKNFSFSHAYAYIYFYTRYILYHTEFNSNCLYLIIYICYCVFSAFYFLSFSTNSFHKATKFSSPLPRPCLLRSHLRSSRTPRLSPREIFDIRSGSEMRKSARARYK